MSLLGAITASPMPWFHPSPAQHKNHAWCVIKAWLAITASNPLANFHKIAGSCVNFGTILPLHSVVIKYSSLSSQTPAVIKIPFLIS